MMIARVLVAISVAVIGAASQGRADERLQPLDIVMKGEFDDSPEAIESLKALLALAPREPFAVTPGVTLSGLILQRYRFGVSDAPQMYSLLEATVKEQNRLDVAATLRAGATLLIPAIPPNAKSGPNEFNRTVPFRLRLGPGLAGVFQIAGHFAVVTPAVIPDTRRAAIEKVVRFYVSESDLKVKAALPEFRSATVSTPQAHIDVRLAAATACQTDSPPVVATFALQNEETVAVDAILGQPRQRQAYVFVLDTGWPSSAAWHESWRELVTLNATVRDAAKMRLSESLAQPTSFYAPVNCHCQEVQEALKPLQARDVVAPPHVKVVYLPLLPVQQSEALIQAILEVGVTKRRMLNGFGVASIPEALRAEISAEVNADLKELKALEAKTGSGNLIYTSQAWIDAVWTFVQLVAEQSESFFFLSLSWTIDGGIYNFGGRTNPRGLLVSAAGNNNGSYVDQDGVDFAARCVLYPDTLTVINEARDYIPRGTSSVVRSALIPQAMVVGYDGALTGAADSATSFATPRVAWVLALTEAHRTRTTSAVGWLNDFKTKLLAKRTASSGWKDAWFDMAAWLR
jgi:hypothetical protein